MFDIIGFKALRKERGTSGLHQLFERGINPAIQHSAAGRSKSVMTAAGHTQLEPDFHEQSVKYLAVSDTVIFISRDDSFNSFLNMVHSAFMLLQFGFSGSKAPYRGAIGWGDLISDASGIILGNAVEDAYDGERSQAWAGCMLTNNCESFASQNGYIEEFRTPHLMLSRADTDEVTRRKNLENANRLVRYPVPKYRNPKEGPVAYSNVEAYAIDWTIRMYEGAAAKSLAPSNDKHAQLISQNTVKFENWARKNNRAI